MDKFLEDTQIRTKIIKEATGIDFIVRTRGAKSSSTRRKPAARAAIIVPNMAAKKKPPAIREKENIIVCQNSASSASFPVLMTTETGDTNSISCPKAMLTACQTASHTTTAQNLMGVGIWPDPLAAVIELISREGAAYRLGILLKQNSQIAS